MSKSNLRTCSKICNECPFSKKSMPGFLAHWSVDEMLEAQQREELFPCHLHLSDDVDENLRKVKAGEIPICRGYLASANKSCKRFGSNIYWGRALQDLQLSIDKEDEDQILTRPEFRKHHDTYRIS